ncbi:MAG: putative restriction endonuclease [Ramlibacter sp.]|nr:putative restriction endonuclease [Ramlibacter sp.]
MSTTDRKIGTPVAYGEPTAAPCDWQHVAELLKPFQGQSVAQMYRGPSWVNSDGVACIVVVAYDKQWPRRVTAVGHCAFLTWRWNDTPSVYFSLTAMVRGVPTPRPHARWLAPSDDPVVQAIRRQGRFLVVIAHPDGQHTSWFDAAFRDVPGIEASHDLPALETLWQRMSTPGIPFSKRNVRFDPARTEPFNDGRDEELPLWPQPESDFWRTIHYEGPWAEDLSHRDRAQAAWGALALRRRARAAGFIQMLRDQHDIDGAPHLFTADGQWAQDDELGIHFRELVRRYPLLATWLAALAGPAADAAAAHAAALQAVSHGPTAFAIFDKLLGLLANAPVPELGEAVRYSFEAAATDASVTNEGRARPWFANTGKYAMELRSLPIDLDAPLEDIERLWHAGLDPLDLIDAGLVLTSSDFPAPLSDVCESLANVSLDCSIEEAEDKIQTLLMEAQAARQWSVPWGARVAVAFGTFVAVRIFEVDGEFTCLFLDDQERYFHVAVGLRHQPPQSSTHHLVRMRSDDGLPMWNEDAELSLKLIAAAIVRDFIVVEERESLFTCRPMRRRLRGRDVRTVIYLPRVRYTTPALSRIPEDDPSGLLRKRHPVEHHLRRANNASPTQRFLAQRYGIHLPAGFTFVKPHERGTAAKAERIRIYRSRSASRMIFQELDTAPAGTRPLWFEFEKDCARLLRSRGMNVIHQAAHRDGDGGVDLFAVDAAGASWVVQCKCWAAHRPVGPDVVRELEGAIRLAGAGQENSSKGMLITTSSFTSGAVSAALALGFEVVDGAKLARLLTDATSPT